MFKDQVVAITGAGSGIGRALAEALAAEGARLALSDLHLDAVEQVVSCLPSGTTARAYRLDVTDLPAVQRHVEDVQHDFGAVHVVVNNAGTALLATVEHTTMAEYKRVIDINLWGVIHGTKAFLPVFLRQRSGCIVNVSSVFGLVATPCSSAYTISKFGVRALTETLWQELDGTGVRAVLVHPGGINTAISKVPRAQFEGDFERRVEAGNLREMSTSPEDCAKQIVSGLKQGLPRLLVGNGARAISWLPRLFPDRYGRLIARKLGL